LIRQKKITIDGDGAEVRIRLREGGEMEGGEKDEGQMTHDESNSTDEMTNE